MKNYKAAIFDFDGVIIDSEKTRIGSYKTLFFNVFGKDINIDNKSLIGNSESENIELLLKINNLEHDINLLKDIREELILNIFREGARPIKSVNRIIKYLEENNIPMSIASNSSKKYVEYVIDYFDYNNFFEIITGDDVLNHKPHPEIYSLAVKNLGFKNHECIAFEDSPMGILSAKSAGLKCVGVTSSFTKKDLNNADYYLSIDDDDRANNITDLFAIV